MNVVIFTETSMTGNYPNKKKQKSDYLVCGSNICEYILIVNRKAASKCQETLWNQEMQEIELSDKYFSWASPYSREGSDLENFRVHFLFL